MGGAAALWLTVEHPARIERVVLVDAEEIGDEAAVFRLVAQPILGSCCFITTTPATMRVLLADPYVHKEVVTPELAEQYARFAWTPGTRQALIDHSRGYDADRAALRSRLAQVAMPALIVWADGDPYFPVGGPRPAARTPDGTPGDHSRRRAPATGEQPSQFNRIVLDWLDPPATASDSIS